MKDEDIEYGKRQQRKLDEGTWKRRPVPQFARDYGVQQYAHHDPAPSLPFSNSWEPPKHSMVEKIITYILWVVVIGIMVWMEVFYGSK
jgi:hypothetical protein